MKKEIICGIYKITSPSGKIYIGQSKDIHTRWYVYKAVSCKDQPKLYASLKKHGAENHKFEIIHICEFDPIILEYWEDYYINLSNATDRDLGLNLRGAGKHGKITEESKEKNRQAHLGKVNIISKEVIERREKKRAEAKIKKEKEKEIKKELSRIRRLNRPKVKRSDEVKRKISNTLRLRGGNRTRENIKKQKETLAKKKQEGKIIFTKEHRRKLSEKGRKRPVSEKVLSILKKNWKGREKGCKISDKGKRNIKTGWIKRKKALVQQKKLFKTLPGDEKEIVTYILRVTKMFYKNRGPKSKKNNENKKR